MKIYVIIPFSYLFMNSCHFSGKNNLLICVPLVALTGLGSIVKHVIIAFDNRTVIYSIYNQYGMIVMYI